MSSRISVIIPFPREAASLAAKLAGRWAGNALEVICAGPSPIDAGVGLRFVQSAEGKGAAIRAALKTVKGNITIIHDPTEPFVSVDRAPLLQPLEADEAEAVYGARPGRRAQSNGSTAWTDVALREVTRWVGDVRLSDPMTGLRAFRTEALNSLHLTSDGDDIDAEMMVKLAAQQFRVTEVPLPLPLNGDGQGDTHGPQSWRAQWAWLRTLLKYATTLNDADNQHEGYNTLLRMEGAPNYNAWLGRRFNEHLGARVLEVGAGIGTITRAIERGRELVIALEMDAFYYHRLKNLFRDKPHVRPYLSDVSEAAWDALAQERLDSILLSNVLEHIEDDARAVRNFRRVLQPGGKLLLLVPALPQLFGSMDEAVGHHRRYTPDTLRRVVQENGFELESVEWMNLVGIPGWFVNGRIFRRRAIPPLQLRLYDAVAPWLAKAESGVTLPVGMSLFAVARAT